MFDRGAYIEALCRRTGFRDGQALWDGLFEARARAANWRGFFASVGAYCAALRAATPADELEADGTLAREAMMRRMIAESRASTAGPIAIVTGGVPTPAPPRRRGRGLPPPRPRAARAVPDPSCSSGAQPGQRITRSP